MHPLANPRIRAKLVLTSIIEAAVLLLAGMSLDYVLMGISVVADEVKTLAERTTQATKQIAAMIKNVQAEAEEAVNSMKHRSAKVSEGIKLADKAGISLKNIVENTQRVLDMIMQIAAASKEQSSTSEQISKIVEAISNVSAGSVNGISQIARSADDLDGLTGGLRALISNFKLNEKDNNLTGPEEAFTEMRNVGHKVIAKRGAVREKLFRHNTE